MANATLIEKPAAGRGVHEYEASVGMNGTLKEGDTIGRLIILRFAPEISLPRETLRAIYLNSGLDEEYVPKSRSASDAWRVATASLKEREIGNLRILVRDWERGRSPRRDITLEYKDHYQDQFQYTSPAAKIYFDPDSQEMVWDNLLSKYDPRQMDAYYALEEMITEVKSEYLRIQGLIDGDSIQRSIKKIIEATSPVPMERATWLIWSDYSNIVWAINKVISALNEYNPEDEKQSVIHILTVVNTKQDRNTVSTAIDLAVEKEVELSLQRMANLLKEPDKLFKSQADVEKDLYERLLQMVQDYELRFRQDRSRLHGKLNLLLDERMRVMDVVAKNQVALKRRREEAKKATVIEDGQ